MRDSELTRRLQSVREPAPDPSLRVRLEQGIPDSFRQRESWWRPERTWSMAKIGTATIAATAVVGAVIWISVAFLLGPGSATVGFAAALGTVADATGAARAVHVVMQTLGREGEDYGFVNIGGPPLRMELFVVAPHAEKARGEFRIEKADRVAVFNGKEFVHYFKTRNEAMKSEPAGLTSADYWPANWIRNIQQLSADKAELLVREKKEGRGRIVFGEKGVDTRPLAPSFLGDFDRETEIEWDLATGRLTGFRIWVFHDRERILFRELVSIEYLESIDPALFEAHLPPDVRWIGLRPGSVSDDAVGPKEVARLLFQAAIDHDRATLELYCPSPTMIDWALKHRDLEILYIGEPFRAGNYPGVYVPYRIRLNGKVKQWQMAVRNDNAEGRWVFDGGV
jgi:hypothetical protein